MRYFKIDFNSIIKIALLGKEHLTQTRPHLTRQAKEFILYFITNGELKIENNGTPMTFKAGDICLFSKDDFQKPLCATDCEYYYMHFDADVEVFEAEPDEFLKTVKTKNSEFVMARRDFFEKYKYMQCYLPSVIHIGEAAAVEYFSNYFKKNRRAYLYSNIEKRLELSFDVIRLFARLERMAESIYKKKDTANKVNFLLVERISDYIDKNFLKDITGEDIEKEFLINFDYANRIFKSHTGRSIIKYRNFLRIECAKQLLVTTQKPIEVVGYESGFKDKFYFSRFFTKCVGVSPKTFREGD